MSTSGETVSGYIEKVLGREEQRRQSLESRAAVVVSGSTAAVAALFGILTYLHDKDKAVLKGGSRGLMYVGLVALSLAILGGLWALRPRRRLLPSADDLDQYLKEDTFNNPAEYSQRQVAGAELAEYRSLDKANTSMAHELLLGQVMQVIGFLCLAGAIFLLF